MGSQPIDYLHELRSAELVRALDYFPPVGEHGAGPSVLEIGAGTGHQALELSRLGYAVTAIDLPGSAYRNDRVFPVAEYDGVRIPAEDGKFDVVFSSNVLEHVRNIDALLLEIERVTTRSGIGVHVLPTPAWRLWTMATHYVWLLKRIATLSMAAAGSGTGRSTAGEKGRYGGFRDLIPARHGEHGTLLTESYYFSTHCWKKRLSRAFRVEEVVPTGLFYTGSVALGSRLPVAARRHLAAVLGSACKVYVVRPKHTLQ